MATKEKREYELMARYHDIVIGPLLRNLRRKVSDISETNKGDSVLEVACGTGEQALLYAKRGAIVTGLDLSGYMLAVADRKKGTYPLKFLQGDATNLPFNDNQFDLTSIAFALHEMDPDVRNKVIEEMRRVTKEGGRMIITDYTIPRSRSIAGYFDELVIWTIERIVGGDHYRNYIQFMKTGGLHGLINGHNLTIEKAYAGYGDSLEILSLKKMMPTMA